MKINHDTSDRAIEQATKDELSVAIFECSGLFPFSARDPKSMYVEEAKKVRDKLKAAHEVEEAKKKEQHHAQIEVEKADSVIALALTEMRDAIDEVATSDQAVMSDFAERAATNPMDAIVWKADDVMYAQARWVLLRSMSKGFQAQLDERTVTAEEMLKYMREEATDKCDSVMKQGPSIDRGPTRLLEEFAKHKAARYVAQLAVNIAEAWDAQVIKREERPYARCSRIVNRVNIY